MPFKERTYFLQIVPVPGTSVPIGRDRFLRIPVSARNRAYSEKNGKLLDLVIPTDTYGKVYAEDATSAACHVRKAINALSLRRRDKRTRFTSRGIIWTEK